MREIPLSHGLVALVDDEDDEALACVTWHASRGRHTLYAKRSIKTPTPTTVLMHRIITGAAEDRFVDHRNGNGLDNRRANLRVCDPTHNLYNVQSPRGGRSAYVGVDVHKRTGRWRARLKAYGRELHIGLFDSDVEAARARDAAALAMCNGFARLNRPEAS